MSRLQLSLHACMYAVGNFTTNLCESWMHIRSKFDGGKQINRIQSGSWQNRCAGASLRQNLGPAWGPTVWKEITNSEANDTFTKVSNTLEKEATTSRMKKATVEAKQTRKLNKKQSSDNSVQSRRDYSRYDGGRNADDVDTDLPPEFLKENVLQFYNTYLNISEAEVKNIEVLTRSQGLDDTSSHIWLAERRKRITASSVGRIAKRRPSTKVASTIKQLLYSTFKGNVATRWGTLQEPFSTSKYLSQQQSILSVQSSGLVVSKYPWLAASPDGLVEDSKCDTPEGIVELKNPYTARDMSIQEAVQQLKDFCLKCDKDGLISLRTSHNYYYQVQATMLCTERNWCDFVVCTKKDIHIERIPYNQELMNSVLPKLEQFYFEAILPELACPKSPGEIREPKQWTSQLSPSPASKWYHQIP